MMNPNDQLDSTQVPDALFQAYETIAADLDGKDRIATESTMQTWQFYARLYKPDDSLKEKMKEYEEWCAKLKDKSIAGKRRQQLLADGGRIMEQIAYLAFKNLRGVDSIKSYQSSAGFQYDLVALCEPPGWLLLRAALGLKSDKIIVEAKNTRDGVSDSQFARLCFIVEHLFPRQCELGIFFSRTGARGFPRSHKPRQRVLRDAKISQLLFHASTGAYVIVFDHDDLQQLLLPGGLPRLIKDKISDVELNTGLASATDTDTRATDLPPHLAIYNLS